jgi:hypothetical protein
MSLSPKEIEIRLERVLLNVQKPGRYTGGEVNQIVKDWETTRTHIALAFPDIYDIGLPNLGLAILYDAINQRGDACAERVYSPWVDMEDAMRQSGIPIYSLESKHSLDDFDIIGITLPYETLYTNALNLLDLAGLPIYAKDRTEAHPLVIAGGHATYNPEPMAAFIDAFLIGEGEEAIHEIINCYQTWKQNTKSRPALLHALARISGVHCSFGGCGAQPCFGGNHARLYPRLPFLPCGYGHPSGPAAPSRRDHPIRAGSPGCHRL